MDIDEVCDIVDALVAALRAQKFIEQHAREMAQSGTSGGGCRECAYMAVMILQGVLAGQVALERACIEVRDSLEAIKIAKERYRKFKGLEHYTEPW